MLLVVICDIFEETFIVSSSFYHKIPIFQKSEHYLLSLDHVTVRPRDTVIIIFILYIALLIKLSHSSIYQITITY